MFDLDASSHPKTWSPPWFRWASTSAEVFHDVELRPRRVQAASVAVTASTG